MPEGPEVRREADALAAALVGQPLERIEFGLRRLARYSSLLEGACVTAVESRGKAMLIHFDVHYVMYSHNQLYGKWLVAARDDLKPTNRSLRVGLHTRSHSASCSTVLRISRLCPSSFSKSIRSSAGWVRTC